MLDLSQEDDTPAISLIVATYGRQTELTRLLNSLRRQSCRKFEVLVVDQNEPGFLTHILESDDWNFPIRRLQSVGRHGISAARNIGWQEARGPILLFPDDDGWYPPWFIERGLDRLESTGADILTGRSVDEAGRSVNGRYAKTARSITPSGVWIMQIEWVTLVRLAAMRALGGYNEGIGTGGPTPWQAAEGPDLILRGLKAGLKCVYEPEFYGYHDEYDICKPTAKAISKARAYGRGMGFVLRVHSVHWPLSLYWVARPIYNSLKSLLHGEFRRVYYFA